MPSYCSCTCYTLSSSWKDPVKEDLYVLLSYSLSACFLTIGSLDFSEFWHGARNPCEVVHDRGAFFRKNFFCKMFHQFSLNLFYNEKLYYLLCSCANHVLGKIFFLKYRPKCSQPMRLQDFSVNYFSRTNWWYSLIFAGW